MVELGKNQLWLAKEVGLQPPQISRIISGYSEATPEILNRIAEALHKPKLQAYIASGYLTREDNDTDTEDQWVEDCSRVLKFVEPQNRKSVRLHIDAILISQLPSEDQEEIKQIAQQKIHRRNKAHSLSSRPSGRIVAKGDAEA